MKRLLRSKANLDILEGFLTELLATNLKRGSWSGTCFSCRSGFATPTETFGCFNSFRNLSDGIINPVTLQVICNDKIPL